MACVFGWTLRYVIASARLQNIKALFAHTSNLKERLASLRKVGNTFFVLMLVISFELVQTSSVRSFVSFLR